jgi:uncharacterized protein DUF11
VIRMRLGRFAAVFTAAALLLGVAITPASAQNPSWFINAVLKPGAVGAGHDAGYEITVGNNGPSNINALRVIVTPLDLEPLVVGDEPTFVSTLAYAINGVPTTGPQDCTSQLPLTCELGTLVDDETVTFTVAYGVPTGSSGTFDVDVAIRAGTGDPDGKNNSRGDKTNVTFHTPIRGGDFDGGFVVGADNYQTNPVLGTKNVQSTGLFGGPEFFPVTIEDGSTLGGPECPNPVGSFGECSLVSVGGGGNFPKFKVVLMVRGSNVPGNPAPSNIVVHHTFQSGVDALGNPIYTTEILGDSSSERCDSPTSPSVVPCIDVSKVGPNYQIIIWNIHNGGYKGGI